MQLLEVSRAVRALLWPLGVKRVIHNKLNTQCAYRWFSILIHCGVWSTEHKWEHFQQQIFGEAPPDDDCLRPKHAEFQKTSAFF
jgi:hypothetical protein